MLTHPWIFFASTLTFTHVLRSIRGLVENGDPVAIDQDGEGLPHVLGVARTCVCCTVTFNCEGSAACAAAAARTRHARAATIDFDIPVTSCGMVA